MYEFKRDDAERFVRHVGGRAGVKGNELHFQYCPYCQGGSKRDKNTFAINLDDGAYNCKRASCGARGNMITLSRDFNFSLGHEVDNYYKPKKTFRTFKMSKIEPRSGAVKYLLGRGISEATTAQYEVTTHKENENIIVFPFRDQNGDVQYIKYRKSDFKKGVDKSKEWCEPNCKPILFGMNQCDVRSRELIITEGQIDSLSVAEAGLLNAVSVPTGCNGFTWVPYCWDWINNNFDTIVVFGDRENDNITLLDDINRRFKHKKIKHVSIENYKDCKDANELLMKYGKAHIQKCIAEAVQVPIKAIKRLADVKAVDIYSMEKIQTGIDEVDKIIGGIYLGTTTILTGKRGDGKSTFMSQIGVNAIEQGYPTFFYSGELMDYYFKRWMDLQIAGSRHIVANEGKFGTTYTLSEKNVELINEWYKDKAFLYDNTIIDSDEYVELLDAIEIAITQYGVKLVCIDNLMTTVSCEGNDVYGKQSAFVGKLVKIAQKYNVAVILVAHPRKSSGLLTNDDVSGSSDITNRVDMVMQYVRPEEEKEDTPTKDFPDRLLRVSKNRLTGKITKDGEEIELWYDEKSKRITGITDTFGKEYGWNRDSNGFSTFSISKDNPFATLGGMV